MQGAGNDFVVLDETRGLLDLTPANYRFLADRHFGVGADQILSVRPASSAAVDFDYVIHNADGGEVEQCGNGARCFMRFVHERGLSDKHRLRVQTAGGVIEPQLLASGEVMVDMGAPVFALAQVPFHSAGLVATPQDMWQTWPLALDKPAGGATVYVAVLSMGNPHAVQRVPDAASAPVALQGPLIEQHSAFPQRVNAGFMQIISRSEIALRVYERGAGETLACGTGACAAVVAGIRMGWLDAQVAVNTQGGKLTIAWAGLLPQDQAVHVFMTGPAHTVFTGEIEIPEIC